MKSFRVPSLILAGVLQVLPIARIVAVYQQPVAPLWAIILRWAGAAAAALGGVEAVSGASTVITNPLVAQGTNGVPFKQFRLTTAPDQAHYWTATGLPPGLKLNGTAGATLWYINGTPTAGGQFNVRVTAKDQVNSGSDRTVSATLVINIVSTGTAPVITSPPSSQTIAQGSTATFTVTATGTAPLSYQWKKDSQNITTGTASSLVLQNVSTADAGSYTVLVSNSIGSTLSSPATLTVTVPVVAPTITLQPSTQTVTAGLPVTLSVAAAGTTPFSYQWTKDNQDIPGATNPALSFPAAAVGDSGEYRVRVSNAGGSALSDPATLTITNPASLPVITANPTNVTVHAGQNATFQVTATGTEPLTYKWFLGSSEIFGATAPTLVLTNVDNTAAGDYSAEVKNAAGATHSGTATLTISILQILSVAEAGDGTTIVWDGIAGESYGLQVKSDLTSAWQTVALPPVSSTNGAMMSTIPNSAGKFFRLSVSP